MEGEKKLYKIEEFDGTAIKWQSLSAIKKKKWQRS